VVVGLPLLAVFEVAGADFAQKLFWAHTAVLYALFVDLKLLVVVVSLPLLVVYEVARADWASQVVVVGLLLQRRKEPWV
jgi:hypothetical protein